MSDRHRPTYACPRGPRDTTRWYADTEPMDQVDYALVDFVDAHAAGTLLDLGCGLGGYSHALAERGHRCIALDVSETYVERARALGVDARVYDGDTIPLGDDSVGTVFSLEVLEHLADPGALVAEAARVATGPLVVSVPNSTQDFAPVPVEFSHMLDLDHRQTFTVDSLRALLGQTFARVEVTQAAPVDAKLAARLLPRPLRVAYRWLDRAGRIEPRYYSRLLAVARDPR